MKKIVLMALALISSGNVQAVQQGFQIGVGFGFQNSYGNAKVNDSFNGDAYLLNVGEPMVDDLGGTVSTDDITLNQINKAVLNYNSLTNSWNTNIGLATQMSIGYKGLFGCNQYSFGVNATFGYENSSIRAPLMEVSSLGMIDENDEGDMVVSSVDRYSKYSGGDVGVRGEFVFGGTFSLGKEFRGGNVSAFAGIKAKKLRLTYWTADASIAPQPSEDEGVTTELSGIVNYAMLEGETNYYSYQRMGKWTTGFTTGINAQCYLNSNTALGLVFTYDIFAPTTFNINDIAVSSPIVSDGDSQLLDSGNIRFTNLNSFGIMMYLTYSMGGSSN